jgi:DNA-binding response OmpR family regulator
MIKNMNILLVEDNKRISEFVMKGLEESGFFVTLAENGTDARTLFHENDWNLILLDLMLPDIDGYELLQYLRFKKIHTPVLVLSALGNPDDKVKALDYGADDYLAKPFHFKELVARIHALARRASYGYGADEDVLECDDLKLYPDSHKVEKAGREIKLTTQEYKLLKLLLENKNKVMTRIQILNSIWGINFDTHTNIVDVYISYLRNKIDFFRESRKMIETVKGVGYVIRDK